METYYFFNERGVCFCVKSFASDEEAVAYANEINADFFCDDYEDD